MTDGNMDEETGFQTGDAQPGSGAASGSAAAWICVRCGRQNNYSLKENRCQQCDIVYELAWSPYEQRYIATATIFYKPPNDQAQPRGSKTHETT